jgi:hypothetical protein
VGKRRIYPTWKWFDTKASDTRLLSNGARRVLLRSLASGQTTSFSNCNRVQAALPTQRRTTRDFFLRFFQRTLGRVVRNLGLETGFLMRSAEADLKKACRAFSILNALPLAATFSPQPATPSRT